MSLLCSEISSRVRTEFGLAALAAEAVSDPLIKVLILAVRFYLHPADRICECCRSFRLIRLMMAMRGGHASSLNELISDERGYYTDSYRVFLLGSLRLTANI